MNTVFCRLLPIFALMSAGAVHPCFGSQAAMDRPVGIAEWSVDAEPEVTIGQVDGPEELLFLNVLDATALSDGTIVVGMYTRNFFELRYFDETGAFLSSAGRYGAGPFENQSGFVSLERLGDSVLVVGRDRQYSVFGPRGEKVRSGRLIVGGIAYPSSLLDSRHLAFWGQGPPARASEPAQVTIFIHDLQDESTDSICTLPNGRTALNSDGLFLHLPFEPRAHWASGGGRVWIGDSGTAEVLGYSPAPNEPVRVNLGQPRHQVSRQDQSLWKEFDLRGTSGRIRKGYEQHHRRVSFPETYPAFQGLQVDLGGNLWVLRYEPPWSTEDYVWDVFSKGGELIALTSIPFEALPPSDRTTPASNFSPLKEIGWDYVLIRHKDDLGVERIRRHSLNRGLDGKLDS